jgi:hypothetical protein
MLACVLAGQLLPMLVLTAFTVFIAAGVTNRWLSIYLVDATD